MKYTVEDHIKTKDCGGCRHWHEWPRENQKYGLCQGDCDRIPKGKPFYSDDGSKEYHYDGYSFEDEGYDDEFHCFEMREGKK